MVGMRWDRGKGAPGNKGAGANRGNQGLLDAPANPTEGLQMDLSCSGI